MGIFCRKNDLLRVSQTCASELVQIAKKIFEDIFIHLCVSGPFQLDPNDVLLNIIVLNVMVLRRQG